MFVDGERNGIGNYSDVTFGDTAIKSPASVTANVHSRDWGYQGSSCDSQPIAGFKSAPAERS